MILELKNVIKKYKIDKNADFTALKGIDLKFDKGQLVSIIGESGSGKSTFMNLVGGLDLDYEGEIIVGEQNLNKLKEAEIDNYRKSKIGFVFQSFNLIPHLSVVENVTMGMQLSGVNTSERNKKAIELLKKVGLEDQIYKKPNQLSGGQKQRVAIARALVNEPEIILADEPTGALDSETSKQILKIIKEIADEGKLVIMVTHSDKVAKLSDRIITVADGEIVKDETIKENDSPKRELVYVDSKSKSLSIISSIKLALKNMNEKRGRNALISLGASIGIASIIFMLSLGIGVSDYMTDTVSGIVNPEIVEVTKVEDGQSSSMPGGAMMQTKAAITSDDIDEIGSIEGVESIEEGMAIETMTGNTVSMDDLEYNVFSIGTVSSNLTEGNIVDGEFPGENEIMIDSLGADELGDDIVGKTISLNFLLNETLVKSEFTVSGVYEASGIGSMKSIYLNTDDLTELVENNGETIDTTVLYITAENEELTDAIRDDVETLGYSGSSQEMFLDTMTEMIDMITYLLAAVAGITLLVSAIMILVVLYISVVERTKEIGLLKALGARRKDIRRIFSAEAFLLGVFSGVIGVVGSLLMGTIVNLLTNNLFGASIIGINPLYMIFGILVSVLVSVVAGLNPAGKAAKLDPVESLRRE